MVETLKTIKDGSQVSKPEYAGVLSCVLSGQKSWTEAPVLRRTWCEAREIMKGGALDVF